MNYLRYHIHWSTNCYSVVTKSASSSIAECIGKGLGIDMSPEGPPAGASGWEPYGIGRGKTADLEPGTYHFTFVRNSWDRAVSCWAMMTNRRKGLYPWLKDMFEYNPDDIHIATQLRTLDPMPDFVGRFENIKSDWQVVRFNTGLPNLSPRNQSRRKPDYRPYYNELARDMVAEFYKDEIEFFGFKF